MEVVIILTLEYLFSTGASYLGYSVKCIHYPLCMHRKYSVLMFALI